MVHTDYLLATGVTIVFGLCVGLFLVRYRNRHTRRSLLFSSHSEKAASGPVGLVSPGFARNRFWSLAVVGYIGLVVVILGGMASSLEGNLHEAVLVLGLGTGLGLFFVAGVAPSERFWRGVAVPTYLLKRSVLFRRHPLWSQLVGWGTFFTVLVVLGVIFVGAWKVAAGVTTIVGGTGQHGAAFAVVLLIIAVIVGAYITTTVRN